MPPEAGVPAEVLTRSAPAPDLVIRYGNESDHVADLRLPQRRPGLSQHAPLVIFLHGGFWRAAYDRTHTGPATSALAKAGYAVCVPEFRRVGQPGGGWTGTFDDVAAAVDRLPDLIRQVAGPGVIAGGSAVLAGHSAGGHLALWAASRHRLPAESGWRTGSRSRGVLALAAVSDLADCHRRGLGDNAATALLGGGPDVYPGRYRAADPAGLLPLECPVRLVHGDRDDRVPCDMSRDYATRAQATGDDTTLTELPAFGHFDVIDPQSPAWPQVLAALVSLAVPDGGHA